MKKLLAILISFLFVVSTFGIASGLGVRFDIKSMDFIFESFYTQDGYISDAKSKVGGLGDAYDGAFYLYIDSAQYYSGTGDYTTEAGGREYVLDKVTMSGLTVSRKAYFPEDRNWVRYLEILHNPTSSPITVDLEIQSNLGSDSYTQVVMTSSGDKIADKNDYWAVSDDQLSGHSKYDPSLAHVLDGPNCTKRIDDIVIADGTRYRWYNVTVNPGQTVVIMYFGGLAMNNNDAIALAQDLYNYKDAKMNYDLQEINQIINWNPSRLAKAGNNPPLPMAQIIKILKENKDKE